MTITVYSDRMVLDDLIINDPAISKALRSVYGKADQSTLRLAMHGSTGEIRKAVSAAAPAPVKPARPVKPNTSGSSTMSRPTGVKKAPIKAAAVKTMSLVRPLGAKAVTAIKSDDTDLVFTTEISKVDDEQRTVFGWASITEVDGQPVVDRQGDTIDIEELSKSAYDYVISSRTGGHQHRRNEADMPLKVSDMIESVVFTPEKIEKMGLPPTTPIGWWVGYKVSDDQSWQDIKNGDVSGFSVHGKGKRVPIDLEVA